MCKRTVLHGEIEYLWELVLSEFLIFGFDMIMEGRAHEYVLRSDSETDS